MRSRRLIAIMMALCGTWLGAATARAQVTTATVYGLVADNTNAVLPGADVTLTNEATGGVMTAVSNDRGEFTLTFVPVGRYTLKVSLSGFGDYEQKGLALAAGQVTRLTAGLGVSGVTDTDQRDGRRAARQRRERGSSRASSAAASCASCAARQSATGRAPSRSTRASRSPATAASP